MGAHPSGMLVLDKDELVIDNDVTGQSPRREDQEWGFPVVGGLSKMGSSDTSSEVTHTPLFPSHLPGSAIFPGMASACHPSRCPSLPCPTARWRGGVHGVAERKSG